MEQYRSGRTLPRRHIKLLVRKFQRNEAGSARGNKGSSSSILDGKRPLPCASPSVIGQVASRFPFQSKAALRILVRSYLILVTLDSATTYVAIKYFGLVEIWQSQILFDYYGLIPGIMVSTAFCFGVGWVLWKVRHFKMAVSLTLFVLSIIELAATANNIIMISTTPAFLLIIRLG